MVGQAGAGSSRTDQPQGTPQAASEDWVTLLPAPACQHPDQAPQQHHSKDYYEREVDEVEPYGGRVYLIGCLRTHDRETNAPGGNGCRGDAARSLIALRRSRERGLLKSTGQSAPRDSACHLSVERLVRPGQPPPSSRPLLGKQSGTVPRR